MSYRIKPEPSKQFFIVFWILFIFVSLPLKAELPPNAVLDDGVLHLDLESALNIALSAQRRLGSAIGNVEQTEINLEVAESEFDFKIIPKGDFGYVGGGRAGAGSTVGAGVEIFKRYPQGTRVSIIPSVMKAAHNFQSNLKTVFTQPLLRGFGYEYTLTPLRTAEYANRSAKRALYQAQTRLILQTVQGLYEIVRSETFVVLEKESLERIRKFCLSTKMKEKIGLCDSLDVYRAENELKQAEDNLNHAEERLLEAKDSLRDTLALPLDLPITVDVPVDYESVVIAQEQAIELALKNRIEIDQADDQIEDMRRQQYVAKTNLLPELNLVVDYSSLSRDEEFTRIWTYKRESKWGLGFTTSTDLGKIRENASYDQSIRNTADAVRNAEQVNDNIVLEVKRSLRTLHRSQERIELQEKQIKNSQKEFHLARVKFEHGLANNFDLIQAEKSLRSAQTGLVAAMIDHKVGQFKLLATLGMLADKPRLCR